MQSHRRVPVFLFASLGLATGQVPPPLVPNVQQGAEVREGECNNGGALTDVNGNPVPAGSKTCANCCQQMVQTYQPPPTITYQPQPAQVIQQPQKPQIITQRSWQYVPGPVTNAPIIPPDQDDMLELTTKVQYETHIKIFEHEIPYIHYESKEQREECIERKVPLPPPDPVPQNIVHIREEHTTKMALRVVQHFPEPVTVEVPMYLGTIDETSQTAHHREWYDLPVEISRVPPEIVIDLPAKEHAKGEWVPVTRRVTVQPPPVPVTVQPPPVPVTVPSAPVQLYAQVEEEILCGDGKDAKTCIGPAGSEQPRPQTAGPWVTVHQGPPAIAGNMAGNIMGNSAGYIAGNNPTGTCGA